MSREKTWKSKVSPWQFCWCKKKDHLQVLDLKLAFSDSWFLLVCLCGVKTGFCSKRPWFSIWGGGFQTWKYHQQRELDKNDDSTSWFKVIIYIGVKKITSDRNNPGCGLGSNKMSRRTPHFSVCFLPLRCWYNRILFRGVGDSPNIP